ncbi:hypothetical protein EON79_16570 [bacterium]|nr:MAG: hypothetical protein EON79_16570 [bacterium]
MTSLIALTFVSPPAAPLAPYAYKFTAGDKLAYSVRFGGRMGSQAAQVAETLTVEVLSVDPDGSAQLKFTSSEVKRSGLAKDQSVGEMDVTARADPYGNLSGFSSEDPLTATLSFMFSLPNTELAERKWTEYPDPMSVVANGASTEGTIRSRRGTQLLFTVRTKSTEGPNGTRETTFDTAAGRLVSSKFRGGDGRTVPRVEVDVVQKAVRR